MEGQSEFKKKVYEAPQILGWEIWWWNKVIVQDVISRIKSPFRTDNLANESEREEG